MSDHDHFLSLIESFVRITNKYHIVSQRPYSIGGGEFIYPSEIHLLMAVKKNPEDNITEMGSYLGISKSAASQTVAKLERKGFCRKVKINNKKNIYLELTEKGEQALNTVCEYRDGLMMQLIGALKEKDKQKLATLEELFAVIEENINRIIVEES